MVDQLLPTKEELIPIVNDKNTFYECGFNCDFDLLPFEKKLQVICDVIRQSIYTSTVPNPQTTLENMIGNCYTAAYVSKIYLKKLGVGKNIKVVFGRARVFEPEDNTTIHLLNLVENELGEVYQFDASPFVGYGLGKVQKISVPFYQEYVEVTDEMHEFIKIFLEIIFNDANNCLKLEKVDYYLNTIYESLNFKILNGYAAKCLKILNKYIFNQRCILLAKELKKYSILNEKEYLYRKELVFREIEKWEAELKCLKSTMLDLKRQLELASNIIQEKKMFDQSFEKYAYICGEKYRLSFINPRVLSDLSLNAIMIKASAYFVGKEDEIRSQMLSGSKEAYGEYSVDLSKPTKLTGLKPMLFSHPLGEDYIRSMMGRNTIFLTNDTAQSLSEKKHKLRKDLCKDMWNKEVIWIDNKPILWHPFVTNLVHSADDYSESALHYLIGYPEHQAMTRFMYPNKKLTWR